jgi:hypothetical protein
MKRVCNQRECLSIGLLYMTGVIGEGMWIWATKVKASRDCVSGIRL